MRSNRVILYQFCSDDDNHKCSALRLEKCYFVTSCPENILHCYFLMRRHFPHHMLYLKTNSHAHCVMNHGNRHSFSVIPLFKAIISLRSSQGDILGPRIRVYFAKAFEKGDNRKVLKVTLVHKRMGVYSDITRTRIKCPGKTANSIVSASYDL